MPYSFEHGIDHAGRAGVAPILVIGGPILEEDFEARDIESVAGVIIVEKGIPGGVAWDDLNLRVLFSRIKSLKYLSVEFEKKCNLDDLGLNWDLEFANFDAPKARMTGLGFLNSCQTLQIRAPLKIIEQLTERPIEKIELIRPLIFDLRPISQSGKMTSLDVWLAKNLTSLSGIESLAPLQWLGIHDCPSLKKIDLTECSAGPAEMLLGGCANLSSIVAGTKIKWIKKIQLLGSGCLVKISKSILESGVDIEVSGRDFCWVD